MQILRETTHDLVLVKPAGLSAESSSSKSDSVLSRLSVKYPNRTVKLPHRLDRITRGILMAALSDEAIRYYNREIRDGHWDKYYLCRVQAPKHKTIESFFGRHKAFLKRRGERSYVVNSGGDPSFLEILAAALSPEHPDEYHVLIRLLTGRYHQIRVMLENLNIPAVGDPLYSDSGESSKKGSFYLEHVLLCCRDFSSGDTMVFYRRDDPEREPISDVLMQRLDEIVLNLHNKQADDDGRAPNR